MIYVRLDSAKIPAEWLARAEHFTRNLEVIQDAEERKRFIEAHAGLWREVKCNLLEMSHGKCWYSEARDDVADWHVDHFRPKTEYQWLAFDWRNFRIAGAIPNRKKSNHFPLPNGCRRACWTDRNCAEEACLLLDPTDPNDPNFMTFDETGLPQPAEPGSPIVQERVQVTTEYLSLDSPRLVEARKQETSIYRL